LLNHGLFSVWLVIQRLRAEYQFGARRAFMQLLKASALLPAVESAAWRSQSEASRLSVLVGAGTVLVSLGGGAIPLSIVWGVYGRGAAHPAKKISATATIFFMPRSPLLSSFGRAERQELIVNGFWSGC